MSWRISVAVTCLVPAFALSAASDGARAEEAFLCGPDTVVYVASAELEQKKRTDPCIAKYFGLTVEDRAAAAPPPTIPKIAAARAKAVSKDLKLGSIESASADTAPAVVRQAALSPVAAASTDYRNVRVLNAVSEDTQWYRHNR